MIKNKIGLFTKQIYIRGSFVGSGGNLRKVSSGMNSKTDYITEACPTIQPVFTPSHPFHVLLVEPLGMRQKFKEHGDVDPFKANLKDMSDNSSIIIVWSEEQEILRWAGHERKMLFDKADYYVCSNKYLKNMTSPMAGDIPVSILRTPINDSLYYPANKIRKVIAMGRICMEKNIAGVIDVFKKLPSDVEKVYIGSQEMWAENENEANSKLEDGLVSVVDRVERDLTRTQIAHELSTAWGYFNVSIYDVGCLSFLESAMSGCHCFGWDYHPMFDEYKSVHRFFDYKDGADAIMDTMNLKGLVPDVEMRNEVVGMHSYDAFNQQLSGLLEEVIYNV